MRSLSIIIPVLNEEISLARALCALDAWQSVASEVIVVDGGSTDKTLEIAQNYRCTAVNSEKGRAVQMNAGAALATGDILLFLHADTTLPSTAYSLIEEALKIRTGEFEGSKRSKTRKVAQWGWFDVRLDSERRAFRIIEGFMNARARLTRVCTGDQALFVRRDLFEEVGQFPDLVLMEDVALSKILRKAAPATTIATRAHTSSRRWQKQGVLLTVLLMWELRLRYFLGESPQSLLRRYYPDH